MDKPRVLIASENTDELRACTDALGWRYRVIQRSDGWAALDVLGRERVSIAVLSATLPGLGGGDIAYATRSDPRWAELPILLIAPPIGSGRTVGTAAQIVDACLPRPVDMGCLVGRVSALRSLETERGWQTLPPIQREALTVTKQIFDACLSELSTAAVIDAALVQQAGDAITAAVRSGDIRSVLTALREHDSATFVHSVRVSSLMALFADSIGARAYDTSRVAQAGLVHDIGKRDIPLGILHKPGGLSEEERRVMQGHVGLSSAILRVSLSASPESILVAERHHERFDGSGYPDGLKGADIDDVSLVAMIADVFSALTEDRPYKSRLSSGQAIAEMQRWAGRHFEPHFLRRFTEVVLD